MTYSDFLQRLIANRMVPVVDDITPDKYEDIVSALLFLDNESSAPIKLLVDSRGGSLRDAKYLYDLIKLVIRSPVHGLVTGKAHSSAFLVLQGCDRRSAVPSATLLFHGNDLGNLRIDQPDRDEIIANLEGLFWESLKIIAARSGQSMKRLREWSREERMFSAREALKLGFIDSVKIRNCKKPA